MLFLTLLLTEMLKEDKKTWHERKQGSVVIQVGSLQTQNGLEVGNSKQKQECVS